MEYTEYTKEQIDFSDKIFKEQEKIIESSNELDFLHAKAEEIFYDDRYTEGDWDSIFASAIWQIEKQHNPASLPVLLRLCDDARFEVSLFQESWLNVFAFGFETEDLCREFFSHLHELFPHAKIMAMNIFLYSIGVNFFPLKHRGIDVIELQKRYILLADPVSFKHLVDTSRAFYRQELFGGDLVEESVQYVESVLSELGSYYDQHRMRLVE